MCEMKLQIIFIVLCIVHREIYSLDDSPLFFATRAPHYFGILQDQRRQMVSIEASKEYMDFATDRAPPKLDMNKNRLDDYFEDDDTDQLFIDEKDRDSVPLKRNAQMDTT